MRAYNSRKTPKEHYLFKEKHHTLSIISKGGYTSYLFKTFLRKGEIIVRGNNWGQVECIEELYRIIKKSKGIPISKGIEYVEKTNNLKIKDLGLTRKDFSGNLKEIDKILERIAEYKEKNKEE